jgi:acetylornithine deacetylase
MDRNDIQTLTAEAVGLLKEMIAIPSPSFSEGEVCSHISNWLTDKGIVHERVGNNIIARLSEQPGVNTDAFDSKPALMLCAHIDTVSASEDYSFDPYSPDYKKAAEVISAKIANGELPEAPAASVDEGEIVAGLGSNDDGASVVSMIATFRYFISSAINTDLILVLSCEEERSGVNGMTGLWGSALCCAKQTNCADTAIKVDYAIVGEPTGMRAATAERGLLVIDATAHGVSGHAARNEGVNAIDIAIKDIEAIKAHTFTRLSTRMGRVNLNVTQINAGTAHNVIPDTCTFVIDIRPTEQYTNEEILAELQSICKSDLKPRNLKNQSSATHEDSPLQSTAESLGIETFSSPTTSDWMRIDCDAIKMGPGNSARSHRKDEFVFTSEIEGGISTYIRFIEGLSTKV